ncbi:MAG: FKBP-type peptidyl-prolyl cis-trans isomerase [Rikenellaceae bacterium]
MRGLFLSLCVVAASIAMSCSSVGGGSSSAGSTNYRGAALSGEVDSLAYIVGLSIGEQLMQMDSSINVDVVCRAIVEYSEGRAAMSAEDGRTAYMHYKLYLEPERRRGYEERYLADLAAADRSYKRTKTGLTYRIDVIGDEKQMPKVANDWVTIRYSISSVDGVRRYPAMAMADTLTADTLAVDSLVIDTLATDSVAIDSVAVAEVTTIEESFVLGDLPKGVAEGLRLIGVGGRINLYVTSKLGYGEEGKPQLGIEPIETVLYQIELVARESNVGNDRRQEQFEAEF